MFKSYLAVGFRSLMKYKVQSALRHILDTWQGRQFFATYILLSENALVGALEQKLPDFIMQYSGDDWAERNVYHLQPLTRIHLYSSADYNRMDSYRGDNLTYLYLVSVTGAFVLLIACVNFVNLATARSVVRAREVGIRKVVGAHRHQLIGQFLGESVIVTGLALLLAIGFAELLLPTFNDVSSKQLVFELDSSLIGGLIGIAVVVGLLSGLYPAVALSGFKPLTVLKGGTQTPLKGQLFQNGLVVFQFSMSVLLMITTAIVYRQVDFMQNKDLGFEKDNIVWLPVFGQDRMLQKKREDWLVHRAEEVKQAFLAHPNVLEAAASRFRGPSGGGRIHQVRVEDGDWDMRVQEVDEDFLSVYGIDLVLGRNFTAGVTSGFILNETAVRRLGWEDPIGQTLEYSGQVGTVIGVVQDYHSRSLHEALEPVLLCMAPAEYINLSLKIRSEDVPGMLAFLEEKWAQFIPRRPFRVYFMDTWVNRPYGDDRRFAQVASIAAVFAIFVACLGLLALASFLASRRTKEIGIRKVLGATVSDIVTMLSRDFLKPVLLANVIAWPIAYWTMRGWLDQFVYRTDLSVWPFVGSAVFSVGIAIMVVSIQAIRAARENPVTALRYE